MERVSGKGVPYVEQHEATRSFSLYGRFSLLLVAVTVLPMGVLGWQATQRIRATLTVDTQHFERVLAERAAGDVQREFDTARAALESIAATLGSADASTEALQSQVAARQLEAWGRSRFVTLFDASGARRGSIRLQGVDARGPESLAPALRGEGFRVGAVKQVAGGPVVPLSVPVRAPSGELRFWLLAELELAPLCAQLAALGEAPPLRDRDALFAVDDARTLVLASDPAQVGRSLASHPLFSAFAGDAKFHQSMTVVTDYLDGDDELLAALATVPQLGWAVTVRQPRATAYASLNSLLIAIGVSIGLAGLLALVIGLLGGRWVVRPLRALVAATRRIARREWTRVEPEVRARSDEVGQLGRAIDSMSTSLEQSVGQLVQETQARAALARYLPADVVDQVVADPTRLRLGGERRLITVLFADVVGFTQMSEHLEPERIVAVLNEYFTLATEIVHAHGGFVDKFIGDCVMAVWGLPEERPDDAARALAAAEALSRWSDACARRWSERYGVRLQLAMGLNTGLVVAGNVGSERRLEYTVIGDTVNVAARLEASAAPGQILLSEATRLALSGARRVTPLGERQLRGRTQSIRVFEVSR